MSRYSPSKTADPIDTSREKEALQNAKASIDLLRMAFKTLIEACGQPMIRGSVEPDVLKGAEREIDSNERRFHTVADTEEGSVVEIPDTPNNKAVRDAVQNYTFSKNLAHTILRDSFMAVLALEHLINLHATNLPTPRSKSKHPKKAKR
jgi:hypothetical protein